MEKGTTISHYKILEKLGEGGPNFVKTSMSEPVLRSFKVPN